MSDKALIGMVTDERAVLRARVERAEAEVERLRTMVRDAAKYLALGDAANVRAAIVALGRVGSE